ncbi:MAG: hypothetical protein J0M37_08830 [Ignavibacteria bacterium]|nr:hypothetical protein [Ignavibacteria bacterium]
MNSEITILNILLLLLALLIITAGIAKTKSTPAIRKYFIYIFSITAVISFIILQFLAYSYLIKFNFYYGINSALLILVLSAIIISPFTFRLINTAKLLFNTSGTQKPVTAVLSAEKPAAGIISAAVKETKTIETKVIAPEIIKQEVIEPQVIEPEVIEPEVIEPEVIEPEVIEIVEILPDPIKAETVKPVESEITDININEKLPLQKKNDEEHKEVPVKKQAVKHKSTKKRTPVQKTVPKKTGNTQQKKKSGREK